MTAISLGLRENDFQFLLLQLVIVNWFQEQCALTVDGLH